MGRTTVTEISARVVLDSISPTGVRLTTLEVVMPRFILSEFNTHRVFSRNSASSRAIPFAVTSRQIETDPFVPVVWPSNKAGMQGGVPIDEQSEQEAERVWVWAAHQMLKASEWLVEFNVHKSLVNRLLEPFMWHTVLVSATEWENFFTQRDSPLAEAHMEMTAKAMRKALEESVPARVMYDGWHLPLIQEHEWGLELGQLKRLSAARCARVSYLQHDGTRDLEKDYALAKMLWGNGHWSPFEHVATPAYPYVNPKPLGNFRGWHQMRHFDA